MNAWNYIRTVKQLEDVFDILNSKSVMAIDTETTGLDPYVSKLRLIQIAVKDYPVVIIDCFQVLKQGIELIQRLMTNDSIKVFQNAKFDLKFLKANNIHVKGRLFDTMIAGQLLRSSGGPSRVGLKSLVLHYLDEEISKEEQTSDFSLDLSEEQLYYAAKDASILLDLRERMIDEIKRNHLVEVARIEFACVYAIADIEYSGIYLSKGRWEELTRSLEKEKEVILEKLYPYIGYPTVQMGLFESIEHTRINLNSNKQVIALLKKHGIIVENSSKHALSDHMDHELVQLLLDHRHISKLLSTFSHGMLNQINPMTHRLHPHYGQNGAYSGRMSCGGPNIQQIPREIRFRDCFTAPKGRKLVIADYSQIELRVIAQYAKDQRMIEAYRSGEDLHKLTASLILDKPIHTIEKSERQAAKAVNFGLVFGMGAGGLRSYAKETYGSSMTLEEALVFRKRFFRAYRGIAHWHSEIKKTLPIEERTIAGRKFLFRKDAGMAGRYNTPIQGTAADILKNALGILHLVLEGLNTHIVAIIHDEIVLECPDESSDQIAKLLKETMEKAGERYLKDVPVIAEALIADSWAEK